MEKIRLNIPETINVHDGNFVTVPSKSWNALCETLITIARSINIHSDELEKVSTTLSECTINTVQNTENIGKLAKIVGDIYETLE